MHSDLLCNFVIRIRLVCQSYPYAHETNIFILLIEVEKCLETSCNPIFQSLYFEKKNKTELAVHSFAALHPLPKTILVWKLMYITKLFGYVLKNHSYYTLFKWNWNWWGSFFKNPPDGAGQSLKCIKPKNWQHFYFTNFLRPSTLLLCEKNICS